MATLRNTTVDDTGSVYLPFGTTAQRPANPVNGDMRFNTELGYIEFYFLGFWINAETNVGGIPMNGLLCLLDIGNSASYNGAGTTITDLSGNGRNGTISGTVTYGTTATGSRFLSGGTSSSVVVPVNFDSITGRKFTVLTVAGYNGGTRGRITTSRGANSGGNNWLLGHWSSGDTRYFAEGWINQETSSGTGASLDQWGVHVGTGDGAIDDWQYWKNGGVRAQSGFTGGSQGPLDISINGGYQGGEFSDWKWQLLAVWNRVLSGQEISDITSAIRTRGGF